MRLSKLQKYILLKCRENKNGAEKKADLYSFYLHKEDKENRISAQVALQNSIENMIAKNMIIAFGHKTAKKWYFDKIKLTIKGSKLAKELIKQKQGKLPIGK